MQTLRFVKAIPLLVISVGTSCIAAEVGVLVLQLECQVAKKISINCRRYPPAAIGHPPTAICCPNCALGARQQ